MNQEQLDLLGRQAGGSLMKLLAGDPDDELTSKETVPRLLSLFDHEQADVRQFMMDALRDAPSMTFLDTLPSADVTKFKEQYLKEKAKELRALLISLEPPPVPRTRGGNLPPEGQP